jgi:hypothetical protein
LARTITGMPLSVSLAFVNHADWTLAMTYINVISIPLGDKIASTIFSFIPMIRSERGLTSGQRFFWESQATAEREGVSWVRQMIMQGALANDTNPDAQFKHLGTLAVWGLAIPMGFVDVLYANKKSKEVPAFEEDSKNLKKWAKNWVDPKPKIKKLYGGTKSLCVRALDALVPSKQ